MRLPCSCIFRASMLPQKSALSPLALSWIIPFVAAAAVVISATNGIAREPCSYTYQGTIFRDASVAVNDDVMGPILRTFDLYVPPGLYPPTPSLQCPLVFILHGYGLSSDAILGSPDAMIEAHPWCRMMEHADNEAFIICAPDGWEGPTGQRGWNECQRLALRHPQTNDVMFIADVIRWFLDNGYNIDANRIYAAGTSNGGGLALRLGCQLGEQIAASAAICSAIPAEFDNECYAPTEKVSILFMNGTSDPYVPFTTIQQGVDCWLEHNSLLGVSPSYTTLPDSPIPEDPSINVWTDLITYADVQKPGSPAVLQYTVHEGGHAEPSQTEIYPQWYEHMLFRFGSQCHDFEVSTEVWNFFKDKTVHAERVYRPVAIQTGQGTGQGSVSDVWLEAKQNDQRVYAVNADNGFASVLTVFTIPDASTVTSLRLTAVCQDTTAVQHALYLWNFSEESPGWELVAAHPGGTQDLVLQGTAANLQHVISPDGQAIAAVTGWYQGELPHQLLLDLIEVGVFHSGIESE